MTHERVITVRSGWGMLGVNIALIVAGIVCFIASIVALAEWASRTPHGNDDALCIAALLGSVAIAVVGIVFLCGHFTLQPNEARVLILFGEYNGTVRESGFLLDEPVHTQARDLAAVAEPGRREAQGQRQARQPDRDRRRRRLARRGHGPGLLRRR